MNEEKFNTLVDLIANKLVAPMESVLMEIRASNRSRWIVLISMLVMLAILSSVSFFVLKRLDRLTQEMSLIQVKSALSSRQLDEFVKLAIKTTSAPETIKALEKINKMAEPTKENIIVATKKQIESLMVENTMESKKTIDANTDK